MLIEQEKSEHSLLLLEISESQSSALSLIEENDSKPNSEHFELHKKNLLSLKTQNKKLCQYIRKNFDPSRELNSCYFHQSDLNSCMANELGEKNLISAEKGSSLGEKYHIQCALRFLTRNKDFD